MLAVFPKGILPWRDRVDLVDTIWAKDPNSLAAEIGAIETVLGTMPQVEAAPPYGPPITYTTLSSRIHDVQMGNQLPVCTVNIPSFTVVNNGSNGIFNNYNSLYDPLGWFNGSDITVQADGWYTITANQTVDWWSSGYMHMTLYVDGTEVTNDHWSWDFPANGPGGQWAQRGHLMSATWQGIIHSGGRVRGKTENGTSKSPINVTGAFLRVKYDRQMSHYQQG